MQKYLAAACGAALVIAAASFSYAQTRPGPTARAVSTLTSPPTPIWTSVARRDDTTGKGVRRVARTPTPPGTDRQKGDLSQTSADPKRDKK